MGDWFALLAWYSIGAALLAAGIGPGLGWWGTAAVFVTAFGVTWARDANLGSAPAPKRTRRRR